MSARFLALSCVLAALVLLVATTAGAQAPPKDAAQPIAIAELPNLPESLPDVAEHEGKPVTAVRARIEGLIWTTPPELRAPKVGGTFSLAAARAELLRLLEGGGFASGSLEVQAGAGGVEVIYRLVPARFVRRVVLKGNELPDDDVRRAGNLIDVRDVTEKSLQASTEKIRAYYVTRGFPRARVEISTIETNVPLVVVVQVTIDAGAPLLVRRRVFAGLPTWDDRAMAAAARYEVKVDERIDEEALDAADRALTTALRGGGFPSAVVTHSVLPDEQGGASLTINVVPGPKVLPAFEGNVVLDRERLLEVLDLKNEADRSPLRLAGKIESAYRRRGYYDVYVEPELLGGANDKQRTLLFRIREGSVVTVPKRVYPCLSGALSAGRIDEEIDSFLDEDIAGEGFGDAPHKVIDDAIGKSGDVGTGARPQPDVPASERIFVPETYERAREHLIELFRSEGYMFVEVGEVGLLRGSCGKGSMPGACKVEPPPPLDEKKLCQFDANRLPLPIPSLDKRAACVADPTRGIECAPQMTVVLPINPGPRSYLWDVVFDGTSAIAPAKLMTAKIAGSILRMGEPLSLKDTEAARKAIVEHYRDEGYYFVNVRATFEYSSDKSRARVRFLVNEGEQVVIDKIYVEGEKRTLESLIRDRLLIREGGVYGARLVRESQDRLVRLGVFQSVSIGLVNPNIPAKRKSVIVNVRERPPQHFDYRIGYSTGEGARFLGEYGYANLFGYGVSFDVRLRISYQPFLFGGALYDPVVVRRWNSEETKGLRRYPRRASVGLTLPHTPLLGGAVRTTIELINVLDLRRDFILDKYILPAITLTYTPWQPLTLIFGAALELNNFATFDNTEISEILRGPQGGFFQSLLRVPEGETGVVSTSATVTFDFRDNKLGATRNGYVSLTTEYVRSIKEARERVRQDFVHITTGGGAYLQLPVFKRQPVLAFELRGGGNFNVLSCTGVPPRQAGATDFTTDACDTYPDRLFYLGGTESFRGFFPGQMLPQDSLDAAVDALAQAQANNTNVDVADIAARAPRGGNVFINPRIELRVPAFAWGGFVVFVDAANTWRDKTKFTPWVLRYAVGPGLSIDTPVGPVAIDVGFNLSRYSQFGEPLAVFNFSIGRF